MSVNAKHGGVVRVATAILVAFGGMSAYAASGDVTVAAGETLEVGPSGASANNSQGSTVTFTNGGVMKAIPTSSDGNTPTYHRIWRDYFLNGAVTYDYSGIGAGIIPELRCSVIATNATITVSADRTLLNIGAGADTAKNFPLYDMPNVVFAAGSGTLRLATAATLRDVPGKDSANVTFQPYNAALAIAGQGIVSYHTDQETKKANFRAYGSPIVLLDESYIPDGVTPVVGTGKTFSIRPSDVVVSDTAVSVGTVKRRVVWEAKQGSGEVPFDIDLNGGTLELVATKNATYAFSGKVAGGGTVDLQGAYTRTFDEVEGTFAFTNTTSAAGTVRFNKVNPGSRLCNCGRVAFEFGEGALPATAFTVTDNGSQYVFVPAADGTIDVSGMNGAFRSTSAFLPIGGDMEVSAASLVGCPKIGVVNGANVTLNLNGTSVPSVVGGNGTFTVKAASAGNPIRVEGRTGTAVIASGSDVELRGTFAGNLTVNGSVSISEPLPWTAADVPSSGLVDWYDAEDAASLVLASETSGSVTYDNAVSRFYPRGSTQATADSGYYLWAPTYRLPFAVTGARGLGAERTWIDNNHPDGYTARGSDGNALRFVPYTSSGATGDAQAQTFRTLLMAIDSSQGGGSVVVSRYDGTATGGADFVKREATSADAAIWPSTCSANVKNGETRLNGAVVDQTDGFTGSPEVLALTAAGDVSAISIDFYQNTQSSGSTIKSKGSIYGEILMYDSVLDADVLANLEAYLMGKWTGVLPEGWSDLREATVTAGTGTVTASAAKMPAFGDGFTGTVSMPDTSFTFTFDGASGTVPDAFVARGATLDLPSAVTVNVVCTNMRRVAGTTVPLFDVVGFADNVEWTFVATGTNGRTVRLREADGKLLLDVFPIGSAIIVY